MRKHVVDQILQILTEEELGFYYKRSLMSSLHLPMQYYEPVDGSITRREMF